MPIDTHLLRNENILASTESASGGFLYATSQRAIKYEKGMFNEKVESLSYSHIVAASYERTSPLGLGIFGVVTIIFGVVFWKIPLPGFFELIQTICGAVIFLSGVLFLFLAALGVGGSQFYQIKAVGLSDMERQSWRTKGADAQARNFARFIQDQINTRELQTSSQSPPPPPNVMTEIITREVVMLRCEYCHGFMPQTTPYCPNCGAMRRG